MSLSRHYSPNYHRFSLQVMLGVIAPSKAWRILQGESPCRVPFREERFQGLATHPYRALDPWRSNVERHHEQDGLSVGREFCRPQGKSRSLKCWYSFEIINADAEGFNVHRRQHRSTRVWRECGDPPESSGRGMQEEIRCRTREGL
jgi:hypothetical protein